MCHKCEGFQAEKNAVNNRKLKQTPLSGDLVIKHKRRLPEEKGKNFVMSRAYFFNKVNFLVVSLNGVVFYLSSECKE